MSFKYFLLLFSLILPSSNLFCLSVNKKTVGILAVIGGVVGFLIWVRYDNQKKGQAFKNRKRFALDHQNKLKDQNNNAIIKKQSEEDAKAEFEKRQKETLSDIAKTPHALQFLYNKSTDIISSFIILYPMFEGGEILIFTGITVDHNKKQLSFVYDKARATIQLSNNKEEITTEGNCVLKEFKISDREFKCTETKMRISDKPHDHIRVITFTLEEIKK